MTESNDNAARRRQLGRDPASDRYRPLEEQAAFRLEQRVGPLQRDPTGTSDWVDAQGVTLSLIYQTLPLWGVGPSSRI